MTIVLVRHPTVNQVHRHLHDKKGCDWPQLLISARAMLNSYPTNFNITSPPPHISGTNCCSENAQIRKVLVIRSKSQTSNISRFFWSCDGGTGVGFWFQCLEECMRNVQTALQMSVSEFRPHAGLPTLSTLRQKASFPMVSQTQYPLNFCTLLHNHNTSPLPSSIPKALQPRAFPCVQKNAHCLNL